MARAGSSGCCRLQSVPASRHTSDTWRFVFSYEAEGDEVAAIFEAQWFLQPDVFLKLNNAVGLSRAAPEFAPEFGVMFVF